MKINIRRDEGVTIIGKKGSGKTQLLLMLLDMAEKAGPLGKHRYIILDTKQVGDFDKYPRVTRLKDLPEVVAQNGFVVYAPHKEEMRNPDYIEGFFEWCYERWNTTVVIDELTSIVQRQDTPDSYKDITDRGRAKHVTFWQGNQKPIEVPHAALSESDHYFCFTLMVEGARKKMAGIMGNKVLKRCPDRYGFYYYNSEMDEPGYIPGIKL